MDGWRGTRPPPPARPRSGPLRRRLARGAASAAAPRQRGHLLRDGRDLVGHDHHPGHAPADRPQLPGRRAGRAARGARRGARGARGAGSGGRRGSGVGAARARPSAFEAAGGARGGAARPPATGHGPPAQEGRVDVVDFARQHLVPDDHDARAQRDARLDVRGRRRQRVGAALHGGGRVGEARRGRGAWARGGRRRWRGGMAGQVGAGMAGAGARGWGSRGLAAAASKAHGRRCSGAGRRREFTAAMPAGGRVSAASKAMVI
jgi:hypothetical protein